VKATLPRDVSTYGSLGFRVGEEVEVRSACILSTLDDRGEFEKLSFMPEMLQFCGQRLIVHKVAHKLCDTIGASGNRRMTNAVHLAGARCDGQAHGRMPDGLLTGKKPGSGGRLRGLAPGSAGSDAKRWADASSVDGKRDPLTITCLAAGT
jgi:hypothetical protein